MAVALVFNQRVLHKASQQSVHPTCGILRDLQAFFWLWAFSTSQTLSTPAHTRVTQTVRQPKSKTKTISEAQVSI